jgi:DNA-binding CsgD family transcriptional regulator
MARGPRSFFYLPSELGTDSPAEDGLTAPRLRRSGKTADGEDLHEWALRKVMAKAAETPARAVRQQRELLADLCRILGARLTGDRSRLSLSLLDEVSLAPRVRQTLERLLQGDSEKQVARRLRLSTHTVHVYVKTLYRKMNVNSRSELLAKFIRVPA